jgi:hypothetical protein
MELDPADAAELAETLSGLVWRVSGRRSRALRLSR